MRLIKFYDFPKRAPCWMMGQKMEKNEGWRKFSIIWRFLPKISWENWKWPSKNSSPTFRKSLGVDSWILKNSESSEYFYLKFSGKVLVWPPLRRGGRPEIGEKFQVWEIFQLSKDSYLRFFGKMDNDPRKVLARPSEEPLGKCGRPKNCEKFRVVKEFKLFKNSYLNFSGKIDNGHQKFWSAPPRRSSLSSVRLENSEKIHVGENFQLFIFLFEMLRENWRWTSKCSGPTPSHQT